MNVPMENAKHSVDPSTISAMEQLIAKVGALHSCPDVARSLLNLTKTADYDVQAVVDCLERDPAMCAKILRLVNSARFGLRRKVTNLRQAVTFVGQKTLRLVAMTCSLVDTLTQGAPRELYDDYWKRSITSATVAFKLAGINKKCDPHDAYTAGLLADLGILLFAHAASKDYCSIYHLAKKNGTCLVSAEREHFSFDHAMLGWKLLADWGFPETILDAVLRHHDRTCSDSPLACAARGGDLMTDVIWTLPSGRVADAMSWLDHNFGVDIDQFTDLALNIRDEIQTEAEVFGVSIAATQDVGALRQNLTEQFETVAMETGQDLDELKAKISLT